MEVMQVRGGRGELRKRCSLRSPALCLRMLNLMPPPIRASSISLNICTV